MPNYYPALLNTNRERVLCLKMIRGIYLMDIFYIKLWINKLQKGEVFVCQ